MVLWQNGMSLFDPDNEYNATVDDNTITSHWLDAIVVVSFHEEHGQVIEYIHNVNGTLSDLDKRKICSLSLPDSNSGHFGDVQYIFRYRKTGGHLIVSKKYEFCYCSAFFRQIKDPNLKRGYFQKSIVLVSNNPCIQFLQECSYIVGPLYFEFGKSFIEALVQNVKEWPAPIPGHHFKLPIAGCILSVQVPCVHEELMLNRDMPENTVVAEAQDVLPTSMCTCSEKSSCKGVANPHTLHKPNIHKPISREHVNDQNSSMSQSSCTREDNSFAIGIGKSSDSVDDRFCSRNSIGNEANIVHGLFQDVPLFSTFGGLSIALWHLWELALCGEPMLVLAPTPDSCSQAVLAIVSLIAPIEFVGDYRPYLTIYDSDFRDISHIHNDCRGQGLPPYILGVTNPYFLTSLEYWPNVISMGNIGTPSTALMRAFTSTLKENAKNSKLSKGGSSCDDNFVKVGDANSKKETLNTANSRTVKSPISTYNSSACSSDVSFDVSQESSLELLRFMRNSSSIVGSDIKTARYRPKVAKREESLYSLLTDQKYERSIIYTRGDPLIAPEKSVLCQLLSDHGTLVDCPKASEDRSKNGFVKSALAMNDDLLRKHFRSLTNSFISPIEAFVRLKAVGSRAARTHGVSVSLYDEIPNCFLTDSFDEISFFLELEKNVPKQLQNSDWRKLYHRFICGPNFLPWYQRQLLKLEVHMQSIFRQLRLNTELDPLLQAVGANDNMRRLIIANKDQFTSDDTFRRELRSGIKCYHRVNGKGSKASMMFFRVKRALENELSKNESERDNELVAKIEEHLDVVRCLLLFST